MEFKKLDEEKKANLLQQINTVVSEVEDDESYSLNEEEQEVIASVLHNLFVKIAQINTEEKDAH
jgi:hypothetical protein